MKNIMLILGLLFVSASIAADTTESLETSTVEYWILELEN